MHWIRKVNPVRGLTVQQYNAFPVSYLVQGEIDNNIQTYFLACLQVTPQFSLTGAALDEFTGVSGVPRLYEASHWSDFRSLIRNALISDLHYFGHGNKTYLGMRDPAFQMPAFQLEKRMHVTTNYMRYAALDGCKTAEKTDFLKAFVGHSKPVSRTKSKSKGFIPRFAWGWKDNKNVAFEQQGTLVDDHFDFITDYYTKLTHRNPQGILDNTYEQAIAFGQRPTGQGVSRFRQINPEGDSINYVGCFDCYFDE